MYISMVSADMSTVPFIEHMRPEAEQGVIEMGEQEQLPHGSAGPFSDNYDDPPPSPPPFDGADDAEERRRAEECRSLQMFGHLDWIGYNTSINPYDLYATLGLMKSASQEDIRRGFHKAAREHHPDKVGPKHLNAANKKMQEINMVYRILSDEQSRKRYDYLMELVQDCRIEDQAYEASNDEQDRAQYRDRESDREMAIFAYVRKQGTAQTLVDGLDKDTSSSWEMLQAKVHLRLPRQKADYRKQVLREVLALKQGTKTFHEYAEAACNIVRLDSKLDDRVADMFVARLTDAGLGSIVEVEVQVQVEVQVEAEVGVKRKVEVKGEVELEDEDVTESFPITARHCVHLLFPLILLANLPLRTLPLFAVPILFGFVAYKTWVDLLFDWIVLEPTRRHCGQVATAFWNEVLRPWVEERTGVPLHQTVCALAEPTNTFWHETGRPWSASIIAFLRRTVNTSIVAPVTPLCELILTPSILWPGVAILWTGCLSAILGQMVFLVWIAIAVLSALAWLLLQPPSKGRSRILSIVAACMIWFLMEVLVKHLLEHNGRFPFTGITLLCRIAGLDTGSLFYIVLACL